MNRIVISICLLSFSTLLFAQPLASSPIKNSEVKWYSIEEAIELNKTEPRKLMVDVYTDWCGWCKVMDKNTFSNQHIASYLNENYYSVKLNAEQRSDIHVLGDTFSFIPSGSRGYNELAAALLQGKLSYPSVVFLNEKIQVVHLKQGYTKAKPFDEIIKFFGGNHYLNNTWEKWITEYKSPIISE